MQSSFSFAFRASSSIFSRTASVSSIILTGGPSLSSFAPTFSAAFVFFAVFASFGIFASSPAFVFFAASVSPATSVSPAASVFLAVSPSSRLSKVSAYPGPGIPDPPINRAAHAAPDNMIKVAVNIPTKSFFHWLIDHTSSPIVLAKQKKHNPQTQRIPEDFLSPGSFPYIYNLFSFTAATMEISTGAFPGSEATPTAARLPIPASPNSSQKYSDA